MIGDTLWTWQDPVALALAAIALGAALLLARRLSRKRGCGSCPMRQPQQRSGLRGERPRVGSAP